MGCPPRGLVLVFSAIMQLTGAAAGPCEWDAVKAVRGGRTVALSERAEQRPYW
jgi:hypothetical protein